MDMAARIHTPAFFSAVAVATATSLFVSSEVTSVEACAGQSSHRSVPRFAESRPAILNRLDVSLFSHRWEDEMRVLQQA